ncbi:occludin-related Y protein [Glaciecola sp. KUL10]|nr:occludin-related Y protein [Glaciecola sp. KUL10]
MKYMDDKFDSLVALHTDLKGTIKEQANESKRQMEHLRNTNHETNETLHGLLGNVESLKKDITNISGDVVDIKRKQIMDNERAHARVDKIEEKNELRFKNIERDISDIMPAANVIKSIGAAIVKWLVPLLLGGSLISAVLYMIKVNPT